MSSWVVSRLNGDGPGALARQAILAVNAEAPAVVEQIAREAVRESLGAQSVTREDFEDFAGEVRQWMQQEMESLRARLLVTGASPEIFTANLDADGQAMPDYE